MITAGIRTAQGSDATSWAKRARTSSEGLGRWHRRAGSRTGLLANLSAELPGAWVEVQPGVKHMTGQDRRIQRATGRCEAHDHGPATRGRAVEPDPPGVEPVLGGVDHADREPVVQDAWQRKDLGLADRIADPGADGRRKVGGQLIKSSVCLNEQMQSAQLLEHPARPPGAGELGRDGSEQASDSWRLRIDHACGHPVEVGITRSFQAGDAAADLVAQPLVELLKPTGYPLGTGRGPLGRGRRDRPARSFGAQQEAALAVSALSVRVTRPLRNLAARQAAPGRRSIAGAGPTRACTALSGSGSCRRTPEASPDRQRSGRAGCRRYTTPRFQRSWRRYRATPGSAQGLRQPEPRLDRGPGTGPAPATTRPWRTQ